MPPRPLVIPAILHQDVYQWSKDNVQEFLEANKDIRHLDVKHIHTLNVNEVTGEVLLGLTKEELKNDYGIKPGTAKVIINIVEQLKVQKGLVQPPTAEAASPEADQRSKKRKEETSESVHPRKISRLQDRIIRRTATVKALYEKLNMYRFVQVRGTPASGKSILAMLLEEHIAAQEPNTHVFYLPTGFITTVSREGKNKGWVTWNEKVNFFQKNAVAIIDEGQLTYGDLPFWNEAVKSIESFARGRIILFASYGSPTSRLMIGDQNATTPINLHPCQRVTLDRRFGSVQDDGIPPVGLYLDAEEFDDFLSAHPSGMRFDKSFSDQVFNWTSGHVGAVGTLIQIVTADHSFRSLKGITEKYTWANLLAQISPNTLLDGLSAPGSVFGRGLPNRSELQDPDLARVLRHVLCNKEVRKSDFQEKVLQEKLAHCFRNGWLHTEEISSDIVDDFVYYFASPLHRWYVEAFLGKFSEADIKEDNLLDFVIQVIRHFSPIHFTTPRTIAGGCRQQQPPEAQFQDEFYRCCNIHTYGIPLLSELGASAGRIDFLLPRKRWGIELVRQSNKLEEHSGRFSTSGKYAGVVEMEDYIILNFCTIYPRVHRELRKLYHVFFTNEYQNVCILDNVLTKVPGGDFSLLMNAPAPLD